MDRYLRPTWWTVGYAVATTIEAFGQARPLWLAMGVLVTIASTMRARLAST